jgi:hypothetical protein
MLTADLHGLFGVLTRLFDEIGVDRPLGETLVRNGYDGISPTTDHIHPDGRDESIDLASTDGGDSRSPVLPSLQPSAVAPSLQKVVISSLTDLASTLLHNVTRSNSNGAHFQRVMWTDDLPARSKPAFHEFVVGRGATLLDTLDDRLAADEAKARSECAASNTRAGVGIYYFERTPSASLPD